MKIMQIIPAVGWNALYQDGASSQETFSSPVACFALVEDEGETHVIGLVANDMILSPEDDTNFIRYVGPVDPKTVG